MTTALEIRLFQAIVVALLADGLILLVGIAKVGLTHMGLI